MDIVERNIRYITNAYFKMEREAIKIGLQVNVDKTKLLMVAASERTKSLIGTHLSIGDKRFEVVNEFVYLVSIISNNYDTTLEIKRRILTEQRAFSIRHLLTSKRISR